MKSKLTYQSVEDFEEDLDNVKQNYLRHWDWTHTCDTPGSYWMWEKKLSDGRVVLCHLNNAVEMQKHLEN